METTLCLHNNVVLQIIQVCDVKTVAKTVNSLFSRPGELLVIFIGSATLVWWPAKGTYKLLENIS